MAWSFLGLLLCAFTLVPPSLGLSVEVRGPRGVIQNSPQHLVSRGPGGLALTNAGDLSYYASIELGDQTFKVLIDTGSSDLWVAGSVANSNDTGLTTNISYAVNEVKGSIKQATLKFADHEVVDQAFLEVPPDATNIEGVGILGMGAKSGSFIANAYPAGGAPVADNLFAQSPSTSNYFTVLLGRNKDPTSFFTGSITVGEVVNGYEPILDEPKLPITTVPHDAANDQHLQILLDPNGIIGPDGMPIPIHTSVSQTKDKSQATAVFDCGYTLPQMPQHIVDAIYSRFQGSEYKHVAGVGATWLLPCVQEVNVTFMFSGKPYPMHPLDMSMELSALGLPKIFSEDGERQCIGTFQPFTYSRGNNPNYDMVLGMAFMRNVYTLFDYGDFITNSTDLDDPYMQLLSITNQTEAHHDFVISRLGGNDSTSARPLKPAPVSQAATASDTHKANVLYYVIAAVAAVAIIVAAGAVYFIIRLRKWRRRPKA